MLDLVEFGPWEASGPGGRGDALAHLARICQMAGLAPDLEISSTSHSDKAGASRGDALTLKAKTFVL